MALQEGLLEGCCSRPVDYDALDPFSDTSTVVAPVNVSFCHDLQTDSHMSSIGLKPESSVADPHFPIVFRLNSGR